MVESRLSRIYPGNPSSNLGKAVEIKQVRIIKFKLLIIILGKAGDDK